MVSSLAAQESFCCSGSLSALQRRKRQLFRFNAIRFNNVPSEAPEPVTPHGSMAPSSVIPSDSVAPSESSESIAPSYSSSLSVVPSSPFLPKSSDLSGSAALISVPPPVVIDRLKYQQFNYICKQCFTTSVAPSESAVSVAPRNVRQTSKPAIDFSDSHGGVCDHFS